MLCWAVKMVVLWVYKMVVMSVDSEEPLMFSDLSSCNQLWNCTALQMIVTAHFDHIILLPED